MANIINDLPKYVALDTAALAEAYIFKSIEILNWSPEPIRLGYDLVGAIETKRYGQSGVEQLARDTAITVQCYGTHISGEIRAVVAALATAVLNQVTELDLYVNGELAYGFKQWTGLQLILEKIPTEYLHEFLTDPAFKDEYELSDCVTGQSSDCPWTVHRADGMRPATVYQSNEYQRLQTASYGYQGDHPANPRVGRRICT